MKISARDIQMFVAGVLSLMGFLFLSSLVRNSFSGSDSLFIASQVFGSLALPLGIGMLLGSTRAIWLTLTFLWFNTIIGFTAIPLFCYFFPAKAVQTAWHEVPEMLVYAIMLGLVIWSRSGRFRQPDA
jgi:hypothetical protein